MRNQLEFWFDDHEKAKLIFWMEEIEDNMKLDDFQRDFFESLRYQFYDRGSISQEQIESLKQIYERVTRL